jgi:hypothetical protein
VTDDPDEATRIVAEGTRSIKLRPRPSRLLGEGSPAISPEKRGSTG